jgi:hypothetical protein
LKKRRENQFQTQLSTNVFMLLEQQLETDLKGEQLKQFIAIIVGQMVRAA